MELLSLFCFEISVYNRLLSDGAVEKIESDRAFARKFVRAQQTLNQELSRPVTEALRPTGAVED